MAERSERETGETAPGAAMTREEAYEFTLAWFLPVVRDLMQEVGQEELLEMLKRSAMRFREREDDAGPGPPEEAFEAFAAGTKRGCAWMREQLTYEVVTDTDSELEIKVTECAYARMFRKVDAGDIGYAGLCYQDYGMAQAAHPDIELTRETTLMQGDGCCHFLWRLKQGSLPRGRG
jgi:hypothetical protein